MIYEKGRERGYSVGGNIGGGSSGISVSSGGVVVDCGGSVELGSLGGSGKEFVSKEEKFNSGFSISRDNEEVVSVDGV